MNCDPVTTIEQATPEIPNSVFPVQGLRRGADGQLSEDALRTVVDGLKSRGMDPTDKAQKAKLLKDLELLLCKANAQYQFLAAEFTRRVATGQTVRQEERDLVTKKNQFVSDILALIKYLSGVEPFDGSSEFIEGWQDTTPSRDVATPGIEAFQAQLASEREAIETQNLEKLRRHMVTVTQEKNKHASNYLGLYGLLNFVAVGLLIYIAGSGR